MIFVIAFRNNFKLFVEVQCNVNKMFSAKKINEKLKKNLFKNQLKRKIKSRSEIVRIK